MKGPHNYTATIHNPERKADWLTIYDSDTVPILSPLPSRANLPGHPNALIYELDLDAITPEQRRRLVAHIAERFNFDAAAVEAKLHEVGMPILASDVTVNIYNPAIFF